MFIYYCDTGFSGQKKLHSLKRTVYVPLSKKSNILEKLDIDSDIYTYSTVYVILPQDFLPPEFFPPRLFAA